VGKVPVPGGDLEHAVLVALWEAERASAREIHDRVGAPHGLVYTTIAKVLDRLHAKGLVARERDGKAFFYRAKVERRVVERAHARESLARLLGPAPRPAMAMLVDAVADLDPALLADLERAVAARRRSRRGS
jgi:predicted transcriptional regulator